MNKRTFTTRERGDIPASIIGHGDHVPFLRDPYSFSRRASDCVSSSEDFLADIAADDDIFSAADELMFNGW